MYIVQCTMYTVHCRLYTVDCTLYKGNSAELFIHNWKSSVNGEYDFVVVVVVVIEGEM